MITPIEQMVKDITNAEESITQANAHIDKLQKGVNKCWESQGNRGVSPLRSVDVILFILPYECIGQICRSTALLDTERATLTEFDTKLQSLEESMRAFKDGVSDAELAMKKIDLEATQLEKEKVAQAGFVERLEKGYEWIREECG